MTLDEFLDDYVPRVLNPMGRWRFTGLGQVRRTLDAKRGRSVTNLSCPLTAESKQTSGYCLDEYRRLGLTADDALAIMAAADYFARPESRRVRARLLAGLGLSEPGGERGSR